MSTKLTTLGLLKIMEFWNKGHNFNLCYKQKTLFGYVTKVY